MKELLGRLRAVFYVLVGLVAGFMLSNYSHATETLAFEVGGGNGACGEWMPDAGVRYDRDSDSLPVRLNMALAPNGGCTGQGVSVDASVSHHRPVGWDGALYLDLTAAYQLQTVPFEYLLPSVPNDPAKHFFAYDVTSAQASAGLGVDFGNWNVSAGYNAAEILDGAGEPLAPWRVEVNGTVGLLEVDFSAIETVRWLSVSFDGAGNTVFGVDAVQGAGSLLTPPTLRGDNGEYELAGGPDLVYRIFVGWEF